MLSLSGQYEDLENSRSTAGEALSRNWMRECVSSLRKNSRISRESLTKLSRNLFGGGKGTLELGGR